MIITVSREFGSGGRELGKRLSDALGIPCYDKEIIRMIAEKQGFDEQYVSHVSEKIIRAAYPLTIGHRFTLTPNPVMKQVVAIEVEQKKIIESFAMQGDCIIIGRCADVILKEHHPFNLFVYADMEAKMKRCLERAPEGERLSPAQLRQKIQAVDKNRRAHRAFYTDIDWGVSESFHLCMNTSGLEIKKVVPVLSEYIRLWFEMKNTPERLNLP